MLTGGWRPWPLYLLGISIEQCSGKNSEAIGEVAIWLAGFCQAKMSRQNLLPERANFILRAHLECLGSSASPGITGPDWLLLLLFDERGRWLEIVKGYVAPATCAAPAHMGQPRGVPFRYHDALFTDLQLSQSALDSSVPSLSLSSQESGCRRLRP